MALEHGTPAAQARRLAEEVLRDWDMSDRTSDVLLVTTELVQNVTQHTSDGGELRLRRRDDAVLIEVTDSDPELPRVKSPSPTAVGGRGMLIVAATARRWGARPVRWAGRTGKVVWAEVTRRLPL
jgi:anti-sigma regulatory factor (Ser/Thr protein kinase)